MINYEWLIINEDQDQDLKQVSRRGAVGAEKIKIKSVTQRFLD